ncbi:hypothetical protein Tco_0450376 [Tanacetum coccineum]
MNAGEILNVDPYEEVAQHGQAHPLSPAYVPDTMELDEHVPLYVPEYPKLHDSSEEDMPVEDQSNAEDANSRDEPENGKDDDEDPEEDPSEEHKFKDEETKEDEPVEDSDETEPFEEDETDATPPSPGRHRARITAPLGHRAAMICMRDDIPEEDMPPRRRFVITASPPGCDIAKSSAAAAARATERAANRAEDVGYARAL